MEKYLDALKTIVEGMVNDKGHQIEDGANTLLSLTPSVPLSEKEQTVAWDILMELDGEV